MADIHVRFSVIFPSHVSQNEKINSKMTTPDTTADSGRKQSETGVFRCFRKQSGDFADVTIFGSAPQSGD